MNGRSLDLRRKIMDAAGSDVPWRVFAADAARLISTAVGGDRWCVAAADPLTLLMTDVVAEVEAGDSSRFFALEYAEPDFLKQRDLACGRVRAGALSRATGGRLDRSARWRELIEPAGMGDQLRGALVSKSECWGYIGVERGPGSHFDARDVALVSDISSAFAEGLRLSMLAELARTPREDAVFLLLDDDLSVVSTTPATTLLDVELVPGALPPHAVLSVAAELRARGSRSVTTHIASRGGWLTLTASRLRSADGSERIAVVVQSGHADILHLLSVTYRFTPRESDIVRLVLHGRPTAEIACTLHISALTVQQHLKSIFQKADVGSRAELVGRVLERYFSPPSSGER